MTSKIVKFATVSIVVVAVGALGVNAWGLGLGSSERSAGQSHPGCQIGKRSQVPSQPALLARGKNLPGPIIIGCGRSNGEAVQIVAYNVRGAFCFGVYRPRRRSFE